MQEQTEARNIDAKLASYRELLRSYYPAIAIDVKRVVAYPYYDRTAFSISLYTQNVKCFLAVMRLQCARPDWNAASQAHNAHMHWGHMQEYSPILPYSPDTLVATFFQSGLPDCRTSVPLNYPALSANHAMSMALRGDCDRLSFFDL